MFTVQVFIDKTINGSTGSRFNHEMVIQIFTHKWPSVRALHVLGHEIAHAFVPRLQLYEGTFGEMATMRNRIMRFIEEWLCHIAGVPCALWFLLNQKAKNHYRVEVVSCE